jgi:acetyltransferase-like isoleucine patch superfamily enzyme
LAEKKKRDVEIFRYEGIGNSLCSWYKIRNPLRVSFNFLVLEICKFLPSLRMKNLLYRMLGMKIGRNVSIGLGAMFDIFFPELIEIGDNTIIGYNSTILTHEFLVKEWRRGKVKIGKNVMIGCLCLIMPGVEIGDGATVASYSLVNKNVKKNSFVGGVPIREIKK